MTNTFNFQFSSESQFPSSFSSFFVLALVVRRNVLLLLSLTQ